MHVKKHHKTNVLMLFMDVISTLNSSMWKILKYKFDF